MLRALFKQGSFWWIINEKTFRDRGSGFVYYPINCRTTWTRTWTWGDKNKFSCVFDNFKT